MTSKEALEKLVDLVGTAELNSIADKITKKSYKNIIEKDLEKLDIITKQVTEQINSLDKKIFSKEMNGEDTYSLCLAKNYLLKIKEELKNDK